MGTLIIEFPTTDGNKTHQITLQNGKIVCGKIVEKSVNQNDNKSTNELLQKAHLIENNRNIQNGV